MISKLNRIHLIANYKLKMLIRASSFPVITLFSFLIVICLTLSTHGRISTPQWIAISLPSAIPCAHACLVISILATLILLLGGDIFTDKHLLNHNPALAVRPYSNTELLLGEYIGFCYLTLLLAIIYSLVTMIIHGCWCDSPFAIFPYIFYLLTITLPAFVFFTGLTMLVKGIVRNKILALSLLSIITYGLLCEGDLLLKGFLDPKALTLPNVFSDVTGFIAIKNFMLQRGGLFFTGIGFSLLAIHFINRLPHEAKRYPRLGQWGWLFIFTGALSFACYVRNGYLHQNEQKIVREIFKKYNKTTRVHVCDHAIEFTQENDTYRAWSKITLVNNNPHTMDSVVLYLNPALKITTLTTGGIPLSFRREKQVVVFPLTLQKGESKEVEMHYNGKISPAVCYAEANAAERDTLTFSRRYFMYNLGTNYHFLQPDYTLLTPECLWYPVGTPMSDVLTPYLSERDYTHFSLLVKGEKKRTIIAQGEEKLLEDGVLFKNDMALPGLTLCIGNYIRKQETFYGIQFNLWLFEGHEYLIPPTIDAKYAVDFWLNDMEPHLAYAFDRLHIIEVPIHFCAHGRRWRQHSELVQPEMILRPEREALLPYKFSMPSEKEQAKERTEIEQLKKINPHIVAMETAPEDHFLARYTTRLLNSFSRRILHKDNLFFGNWKKDYKNHVEIPDENNCNFLLKRYHYFVYSNEFRGIDFFFRAMQHGLYSDFSSYALSYPLIQQMKNKSLKKLSQEEEENDTLFDAIESKGYFLFLRVLLQATREELEAFNEHFLQEHQFQSFDYQEYCAAIQRELGVPLLDLTRSLYEESGLPAFYVKDAKTILGQTPDGEENLLFSIKIWNKSTCGGLISIGDQNFWISAGACKEIKTPLQTYFQGGFHLRWNCAQNIPGELYFEGPFEPQAVPNVKEEILDIDTLVFSPTPGVYIVDNEDSGCRILEQPKVLNQFFRQLNYRGKRWDCHTHASAYGQLYKSFLIKQSGENEQDGGIEWQVCLPEKGKYELFIYNPKYIVEANEYRTRMASLNSKRSASVQSYRFQHAEREEIMTISLPNEQDGWVSLGCYPFPKGVSKITLLDKTIDSHQYLIADAVKWVRIISQK